SAEGDLTVRNIGRDPSCPRRQRQAEGGTPHHLLKSAAKSRLGSVADFGGIPDVSGVAGTPRLLSWI
ncbi:MAG: hypothetical protein WA884_18150, partial [Methyloceanibacter sp.]